MDQAKNWIAFFVVAALIVAGWVLVPRWLEKNRPVQQARSSASSSPGEGSGPGSGSGSKPASEEKKPAGSASGSGAPPVEAAKGSTTPRSRNGLPLESPPPPRTLYEKYENQLHLGQGDDYFLNVQLDTRGAGVRSVTLKQFEEADSIGKPIPHKKLELIPASENEVTPSYLMYAYPPGEDRPYDTLGRVEWKVDETWQPPAGEEGARFRYETRDFILTKTYTLKPRYYDLGLEVGIERKSGVKVSVPFQYQLTGGHGLPIEGGWYTSVYRNAIVGQVDPNSNGLYRNLQDLKRISTQLGGTPVVKDNDKFIQYAAVAVQYFTSAIVVDEHQAPNTGMDFLARVQPTVESLYLRGTVRGKEPGKSLEVDGEDHLTHVFDLPSRDWHFPITEEAKDPDDPLMGIATGAEVVVRYRLDAGKGEIITQIFQGDELNKLYFDDITVRAVSKPLELKPGESVVQRYLLYQGPVKVRLLENPRPLTAGGTPEAVAPDLVNRYADTLHLKTLTDNASSNWISEHVFDKVGWTWLIIRCTNIIHNVLYFLHSYVMPWSYGLCIIMLTALVRGMMFPLSRKQAMMSLKMQALAPEMQKLKDKFKEDRQALNLATMELYRKHGVNPLGSCWVAVVQLPIFMGLYYALQESVDLRLAPFLWIQNLAAPDMLIRWGWHIPWISAASSWGSFIYLGPYFNVLPVLAVALMILQQKYMMPPAQDDQQATQQKMMKFMMIFMGLLFYKIAAGLGLYFITSSAWGFFERKLLPKKKGALTPLPENQQAKPSFFQRALMSMEASRKPPSSEAIQKAPTNATSSTPTNRRRRRGPQPEANGQRSWLQIVRDWWAELLKKAEKR